VGGHSKKGDTGKVMGRVVRLFSRAILGLANCLHCIGANKNTRSRGIIFSSMVLFADSLPCGGYLICVSACFYILHSRLTTVQQRG
jgi:hypothetical protein